MIVQSHPIGSRTAFKQSLAAARRCAVVAGFLLGLAPTSILAEPALSRAIEAARASALIPSKIIEQAETDCSTAFCFAETLARRLPDLVRLEPVIHPHTDSIRWTKTSPSLLISNAASGVTALKLKLTHFGRKAVTEFQDALVSTSRPMVEIDLRGNEGGDFERMLEIAGLFTGPVKNAVKIDYPDHQETRSIHGPAVRDWQVSRVEIDNQTASAALLLARLLETHAGAKLAGPPTMEKPVFLKRRITISHDWRFILPIAEIQVTKG